MEKLRDVTRRLEYWVRFVGPARAAAGLAATVGLGLLGLLLFLPSPPPAESSIPVAGSTVAGAPPQSVAPGSAAPSVVRVHVAGAVRNPGVYRLRSTDRVIDAVVAAGGPSSNADLDSINLAQTILDTEQIYVPRRSSVTVRRTTTPRLRPKRLSPVTTSPAPSAAPGRFTGPTVPARVNINTATAAQLDALPGVGPSTAKAIIAYRQSKGPFARIDDLLNVPGIGPAKLDAMRGMIEA